MNIPDVTSKAHPRRRRKRRGRGPGSGLGKTAGRGHKGAHSRSGWRQRYGYEGGQMSLVRRSPKRGFSNARYKRRYDIVNLNVLEANFQADEEVRFETLEQRGLLKTQHGKLKVLGEGDLSKSLRVVAHRLSASAREKIEAAGGAVEVLEPAAESSPQKSKAQSSAKGSGKNTDKGAKEE